MRFRLDEQVRTVAAADGQPLAITELAPPGGNGADSAPFLLLHGFAQNRRTFSLGPMPESLLARGARVFLGELRGHGRSRVEPGQTWDMATHLDLDLPALVRGVEEATGADSVHLVGHSMGGLLGAALLERDVPLASFTAVATPLLLGAARPLVRLLSLAAGPLATAAPRTQRVPMHWLLAALARPLATADASQFVRLVQRASRLANPEAAPPEALHEILSTADPESPRVMAELARNALRLRPRLAGVDLARAIRRASIPIAAVVAGDDLFAPRAAVAPIERGRHAGPRKVIEIARGTHIDAAMGDHVPETIDRLWPFLVDRRGE